MAWNQSQPELIEYSLSYSDTFLYHGSVEFRHRSYSKLVDGLFKNGEFKFLVDGVDQNVGSDSLTNGLWSTIERDISSGFHQIKWVFTRYINLP
jgi:hypothetical protein